MSILSLAVIGTGHEVHSTRRGRLVQPGSRPRLPDQTAVERDAFTRFARSSRRACRGRPPRIPATRRPSAEGPPQKAPPPKASLGAHVPPPRLCQPAKSARPNGATPETAVRDPGLRPADRRACYQSVASCAVWEVDKNCRTSPDTLRAVGQAPDTLRAGATVGGRCQRPARNRAATRSRGNAGVRWPSRPVISSFATSALATASSVACTTAAKNGFICAQGMNLSWS